MERGAERAKRYRALAEEIRTGADGTENADARRTLMQLADSYELMADHAEARVEKLTRKAE